METYYNIFTDGGARGNPGPAGIGAVIELCTGNECQTIVERHKYIGETTNNQAEYQALLLALEELLHLNPQQKVVFHMDSRLVIEQVLGNYKMKNEGLKPLLERVKENLKILKSDYSFIYIPRERNKHADKLANQAMDEGMRA